MEVAAKDIQDLVLECARLREERDAMRLRLAEVERERDAAEAEATRQRERAKRAERQVEDVTRERDEARRAARVLVRFSASEDPPSCEKWRAAADTALAYEVEP